MLTALIGTKRHCTIFQFNCLQTLWASAAVPCKHLHAPLDAYSWETIWFLTLRGDYATSQPAASGTRILTKSRHGWDTIQPHAIRLNNVPWILQDPVQLLLIWRNLVSVEVEVQHRPCGSGVILSQRLPFAPFLLIPDITLNCCCSAPPVLMRLCYSGHSYDFH